jgi:hypothetical protein
MVRRYADGVQLITRRGVSWTDRFTAGIGLSEKDTKVYRIILHSIGLTKKRRVMDIRATQTKNETSMRTLDSTLSLIRRGPYELRVMKLQEDTEGLWLELIDHHRKRTIDSYRGRDLEDIAVAARSLRSRTKMLRRASIRTHP